MNTTFQQLSLLLLGIISIVNSQQFSPFKSYKDSRVKPRAYARNNVRHAISEYLDPTQIKMLQKRNSLPDPEEVYTDKWTGFNKNIDINKNTPNSYKTVSSKDRRILSSLVNHNNNDNNKLLRSPHPTNPDVSNSAAPEMLIFVLAIISIIGLILYCNLFNNKQVKYEIKNDNTSKASKMVMV